MLKDLTPDQLELAQYMSSLSEEAYCAVWMTGLEYALWDAVAGRLHKYGRLRLTSEHIQRLQLLSKKCSGWIVFDDSTEETWVAIQEWIRRYHGHTRKSDDSS